MCGPYLQSSALYRLVELSSDSIDGEDWPYLKKRLLDEEIFHLNPPGPAQASTLLFLPTLSNIYTQFEPSTEKKETRINSDDLLSWHISMDSPDQLELEDDPHRKVVFANPDDQIF